MTNSELKDIFDAANLRNACERAYILHDFFVNQDYDNKRPYSYHLKSVVEIAKKYVHEIAMTTDDVPAIIFAAAWHDSIEDARKTYNDVLKIANEYLDKDHAYMATEIVYALTNEKGRNRAERANEKYYAGIRETPYAPFVKMCDRLANMEYSKQQFENDNSSASMWKKYNEEMPHFIKSISVDSEDIRYTIPSDMILN